MPKILHCGNKQLTGVTKTGQGIDAQASADELFVAIAGSFGGDVGAFR
jgi:hypothetical protein